MTVAVIDASVGVKWFVPEPHSVEARQWRSGRDELHAPAFFFELEISNILWKKVQRAQLALADAELILQQLPGLPITRHPEPPLLSAAFDLAVQTRRSVYDSLYLTLAIQLNGRMITADQRLCNSLAGTAWAQHVCWVADYTA